MTRLHSRALYLRTARAPCRALRARNVKKLFYEPRPLAFYPRGVAQKAINARTRASRLLFRARAPGAAFRIRVRAANNRVSDPPWEAGIMELQDIFPLRAGIPVSIWMDARGLNISSGLKSSCEIPSGRIKCARLNCSDAPAIANFNFPINIQTSRAMRVAARGKRNPTEG